MANKFDELYKKLIKESTEDVSFGADTSEDVKDTELTDTDVEGSDEAGEVEGDEAEEQTAEVEVLLKNLEDIKAKLETLEDEAQAEEIKEKLNGINDSLLEICEQLGCGSGDEEGAEGDEELEGLGGSEEGAEGAVEDDGHEEEEDGEITK